MPLYDNVLPAKGYRKRNWGGGGSDEFEAKMELWLAGETRKTQTETYYSATLSTMNLKRSHLVLNPRLWCEKPVPTRLSIGPTDVTE
jgi:hypothetical protein